LIAQAAAVLLAGAGVAVLAFGDSGGLWISLAIALSFGFYGLIRKLAPVEAFEGLTIETLMLAPVALGYLVWLSDHGGLSFGRQGGLPRCRCWRGRLQPCRFCCLRQLRVSLGWRHWGCSSSSRRASSSCWRSRCSASVWMRRSC